MWHKSKGLRMIVRDKSGEKTWSGFVSNSDSSLVALFLKKRKVLKSIYIHMLRYLI